MAVPGYQEFMLPLLKIAADGKEHSISDAAETLAAQMGVSIEDQELMLPSGTQTRYYNRVTWAVTYLTKSLLMATFSTNSCDRRARCICSAFDVPPAFF